MQGLDVDLDADLEAVEAGDQRVAPSRVDVEHELVVTRALDPSEHVDLAGGLQEERPPPFAGGHGQQILRDLPLQVAQRVRPADPHDVTRQRHPRLVAHPSSMRSDTLSAMADVDQLARQLTSLITTVARRVIVITIGVAVVTFIIGGLSYLTGIAGLDGSARSAWMVIGAVMLVVAVGAPLLAWWRLSQVSRHATELVTEVGRLISRDPDAERVVIDTVTVDQRPPDGIRAPAIIETRQFSRLRQSTLTASDLRELPGALRAVTMFPWLLLIAIVLMLVFGVLGFLFLIAWIV